MKNIKKVKKINLSLLLQCTLRFSIGGIMFLALQSGLQGQSTVSASGGNGTGAGGSVAYTIGQVGYTNFAGENGSISLGVQQPNLFLTVGIEEADITVSASLFPNPASTSTSLKLVGKYDPAVTDGLAYSLYDLNGRLLFHNAIEAETTSISIAPLAEAIYILQVTRNNTEIKSFRIVKTN